MTKYLGQILLLIAGIALFCIFRGGLWLGIAIVGAVWLIKDIASNNKKHNEEN